MTNPTFVPYRIVPETHPVVRQLFALANRSKTNRKELARISGVSVSNIANWEVGTRPRVDMLDACFQALGYTLSIERMPA